MESENSQDAPLGVLLIATYWIFVGIILLATLSSSRSQNIFTLIPTLIAVFLISLGWGLLTLRAWAYYIVLILSILGSISAIFIIPVLISSLIYSSYWRTIGISSLLPFLIYILFIPMAWFLFKNGKLFVKKPDEKFDRRCPNCGRIIPFDSRICPYCGKKFEEPSVKEEEYEDPNWDERLEKILGNNTC